MLVRHGVVVCSASDLKAAVECQWAPMRRLDAKLGSVEAVPEPEDAIKRPAAALGDKHGRRQLDNYVRGSGEPAPAGRAGSP